MTDAGRALWMETMGREASEWDLLMPLTREVWDRRAVGDVSFVPSASKYEAFGLPLPEDEEFAGQVPEPEIRAELIDPKDKRINTGAKTVMNRFLRNGWTVEVSYARGPWIMTRAWHVCDSILVRARRGNQRCAAQWIRKEWLEKDTVDLVDGIAVPAAGKPIWSCEIMRVNDNQGNLLKAGELKAITEGDAPTPTPIDELEGLTEADPS